MYKAHLLPLAALALAAPASAQTVTNYWNFSSATDLVGAVPTSAVGTVDMSIHATYLEAYPGSGASLNSVTGGLGAGGGHLDADVHDGLMATALDFGTADWSFSYWSFNANDGDGRGPRIFDHNPATGATPNNGVQLGTNLPGEWNFRMGDGSNNIITPPPSFFQAVGSWIHVAVNVDRTGGMLEVYFDNVLQGSVSIAGVTGSVAPGKDMDIGVINGGTNVGQSQQAGLDDLAFYTGLLDATDRALLASGAVTPLAFGGPSGAICTGDGGNQMGCTNCPCTNNAIPGSGGGCLNSSGSGTRLMSSGSTSVSLPSGDTGDLRFAADGAPPTAFCILNSGDAVAPGNMANPCFGLNSGAQAAAFDGLRCAITNTRRHGGRSADALGTVGTTNSPWGGEGGPPVGIAQAGGGFVAGQTRYFQIINRDDPLLVCMRGLNTSQAIEITFTP